MSPLKTDLTSARRNSRAAIYVDGGSCLSIVTLETARLVLRGFQPDDIEPYAALIFADSEVMRYLPKRDTPARERAERTMDFFNEHWTQYPNGPWAVQLRETGELIGHCGLRFIPDIGETEVLYAFGKDFWGNGYATEAARASVDFGFEQAMLQRIVALADPANTASRRVMKKCGLTFEKETHLFGMDVVYYAVDRGDKNDSRN
jgi:ribosomal-protein-alanine N-acetyltransferase